MSSIFNVFTWVYFSCYFFSTLFSVFSLAPSNIIFPVTPPRLHALPFLIRHFPYELSPLPLSLAFTLTSRLYPYLSHLPLSLAFTLISRIYSYLFPLPLSLAFTLVSLQCLKVLDYKTNTVKALKIIRNKKRFHHQALVEVNILEYCLQNVSQCQRQRFSSGDILTEFVFACTIETGLSLGVCETLPQASLTREMRSAWRWTLSRPSFSL